MKKQNAVVARNYATQKYADTLIDKTNILNNKALDVAQDATDNAHRDDYLYNNNYTGGEKRLNNSLINVGGEYAYITQGGSARQIDGGIISNWTDTGNNNYVKFTDIPYSNCPNGVITLSKYDSIDELKSNNTSIFEGNTINNPTLTSCGAEGEIVYINRFMKFTPVKMGGDNRFQVGEGNGFVFLDKWKTSDWKSVERLAGKLACNSGYQVMKLVIGNENGLTYVYCYASDYNIDDIGLSDKYSANVPLNKSTVAEPCNKKSLFYPKKTIRKLSSDVRDGIPKITDKNGGKIRSQKYTTKTNSSGTIITVPVNCSRFKRYTQPYNIICDEMSDYPESIPFGIQRCNAVYAVWHQGIKNSNIYVGNVGYITPDGKVQHISKNMLMYIDNNVNKLITYTTKRVCMQSKQYMSNTNQILKTVDMSLEAAKVWCANNKECAGFHILDDRTVTFFKKAGVQCGESLQTYNSMLPLTEDPYTYENGCTTVWKPLVLKIKNPNNNYLTSDNINNPTFGQKNRGNNDVDSNYFYDDNSDYNWDVRNITGGCPYTIRSELYGQLWYGYRNNGYTAEKNPGFICKTLQSTTNDYYNSYITTKLPNSINQIKTQLLPNLQYVANTLDNIMNASKQKGSTTTVKNDGYQIEGLTTIEKEYGDEIVNVLNESIPKKVTFNGKSYTITNKNQLNSYGIINAQLEQGLITRGDANTQLSVLLTGGNPKSAIMKGKSADVSNTTTTTDDTVDTTETTTDESRTTTTTMNYNETNKTKGYKTHGPVEFPSRSTKSSDVINIIDTISENPQGLNQQMGTIINQFDAMGQETNGVIEVMDKDSSVMLMKNVYGYGGWILVCFLIIVSIILFGFNLIPSLNNRMILLPLTIILGVISVLLLVVKYNLWDDFIEFLNYFIYYK